MKLNKTSMAVAAFALSTAAINAATIISPTAASMTGSGQSITLDDGSSLTYFVDVFSGSVTDSGGDFRGNETSDDFGGIISYSISFDRAVTFTINAAQSGTPVVNGESEGIQFATDAGVFTGSAINGAILDGLGTSRVVFTSTSNIDANVDFSTNGLTVVGTTEVSFDALGLGTNNEVFSFSVDAVPEPSSTALLGLAGLALIARRKR